MTLTIKNLDRTCLAFFILLTMIGGYLAGRSFVNNQKLELEESELRLKKGGELIQIERDIKHLREVLSNRKIYLRTLDSELSRKADIGEFLTKLDSLIKKNQAGLISVRQLTPEKDRNYNRIPIHLVCTGSFIRIYNLIRDLESMDRMVTLDSMTITSEDSAQVCRLEVTVSMFEYENSL